MRPSHPFKTRWLGNTAQTLLRNRGCARLLAVHAPGIDSEKLLCCRGIWHLKIYASPNQMNCIYDEQLKLPRNFYAQTSRTCAKARARAAGSHNYDGGAGPCLATRLRSWWGQAAVIASGESGEEKCRRLSFCAMNRVIAEFADNRQQRAASGVFCPSSPSDSCP
jgi:hypothetical protein